MKYGKATTDLHAKSNMHHQTNIAMQTNVCISYSDTEVKQKYNWWPEVSWVLFLLFFFLPLLLLLLFYLCSMDVFV